MPSTLDLAQAATVVRDAMRDKSYRATPIGLAVGRYIRWKRNEWGASERTLPDYESTLAALALFYADLAPEDFEPPVGTERVREFLAHLCADHAPATRAKKLSILRDFFRWLVVDERALNGDPTLPIRRPKLRDPERRTFSEAECEQIVRACGRGRDVIAVALVLSYGLRKGELRGVRIGDYRDGVLDVLGKGQRRRSIPIVDMPVRIAFEQHASGRESGEYLLHPEHWGKSVSPDAPPKVLLWAEPTRKLSDTATHVWWCKLLERAGVPHLRMHGGRHTALTRVWRKTGDLELTRQLAGHKSIQTTADVYVQSNVHDLARGLSRALGESFSSNLDDIGSTEP